MLYRDYIQKVSDRFVARFDEIDPHWNFDQGTEFEIALATTISDLLPAQYGVCRGFVTPPSGASAGDDIIIYDNLSTPLLRPPTGYDFTRKEDIPVESVYAYIEAKNTLELVDKNAGTSIQKAVRQTTAVKSIARPKREFNEIVSGVNTNFKAATSHGRPNIFNPLFTAIISRGAREDGKLIDDPYRIKELLQGLDTGDKGPDLVVIGPDLYIIPMFDDKANKQHKYETPFAIPGRSYLSMEIGRGLSYGLSNFFSVNW